MHILVIGGTRNIGHYLTLALLEQGHRVTILNRGVTPDSLPESVERLRADRSDAVQLQLALGGRDFDVVAVSFDPRDTPMAAAAKKAAHIDRYGRAGSASGFHFLTGDESSIRALTDAVGFKYQWDEATQQYAHASGFVVATPDGRLSRYFYGIEYAPRDLKFALIESSAGRVGSIVDQVLLYCYHYDPKSGSYSFVAMKAIRLGGAFTLLALAGFVVVALRRDERVRH